MALTNTKGHQEGAAGGAATCILHLTGQDIPHSAGSAFASSCLSIGAGQLHNNRDPNTTLLR